MGLRNTHNLCYANAVVQCIAACPVTSDKHLSRVLHRPHHPLLSSLQSIIAVDTINNTTNCEQLCRLVSAAHPSAIQFGEHNDACEFFMLLVDDIVTAHPFLKKCFFGDCEYVVRCTECQQETRRESAQSVWIVCPDNEQKEYSLSDMLLGSITPQIPEDSKCEKCSGNCVVQHGRTKLPLLMRCTAA